MNNELNFQRKSNTLMSKATITGRIISRFKKYYNAHGITFLIAYIENVKVCKNKKVINKIPIVTESYRIKEIFGDESNYLGKNVEIKGVLKCTSYLEPHFIYIHTQKVMFLGEEYIQKNEFEVEGIMQEIADHYYGNQNNEEETVEFSYEDLRRIKFYLQSGKFKYMCIAWNASARFIYWGITQGDHIKIKGDIQERTYKKGEKEIRKVEIIVKQCLIG